MSKKSARMNVTYNRQTKAWQQNQMKRQMAEAGYAKGMPKGLDANKLRKTVIIGGIVWLVLTILLTVKFRWTGLLIGLLIALLATGGVILYMRKKEKDILRYHKKMGVPKGEFMKQMRKNSKEPMTKKQMDKMSKSWDKIKVD